MAPNLYHQRRQAEQALLHRATWTRTSPDTLHIAQCLRLLLKEQYVPLIIVSILDHADAWPQQTVTVSGTLSGWNSFHVYLSTDRLQAPPLRIRLTASAWSRRGGSMEPLSQLPSPCTTWWLFQWRDNHPPPINADTGTVIDQEVARAYLRRQDRPRSPARDGSEAAHALIHRGYIEDRTPWTTECVAEDDGNEFGAPSILHSCKARDVLQTALRGSKSLYNHCESSSLTVWTAPGFDVAKDLRLWGA